MTRISGRLSRTEANDNIQKEGVRKLPPKKTWDWFKITQL